MKIDFVISWVDGNDPKWKNEKDKYSPIKADESNSANRYRDWGLLLIGSELLRNILRG